MSRRTSTLAQLARELAEQKLQQEQQEVNAVSRQLEQLEDRMAVYRYHALQASPNPPPELRYPPQTQPQPVIRPPRRQVYRFMQYKHEIWSRDQESQKTVLVIDNGGMAKLIEPLSYVYRVVVWRLENSRQPLPEVDVQVEYKPLIEFDYDSSFQQLAQLQQETRLALILVDGLIWQTPLIAAADLGIPVVLCFEDTVNVQSLMESWIKSRWRIQQSFMWAFEVLCCDSSTIAFFVSQGWLPSSLHSLVQDPENRDSDWWYTQIRIWCKRHRRFLAQSRYLKKHRFDLDYFLGHEAWRRNNSLDQQLIHFLFSWRMQSSVRQLIPGFDMRRYADLHPDINDIHPLADYLRRRQPRGPWQLPIISPGVSKQRIPRSSGVALHIHAYYIDSLPTFIQALTYNHVRPDLYISVRSQADLEQAQQDCAMYPVKVDIRVVPNRGRDIGAFLTEFGPELVEQYEIIGHVHTKQSLFHTARDFITAWQEFLLVNLLGNQKYTMADEIIAGMQHKPKIGIVFADDPNVADWGANQAYGQLLMQQMGFNPASLPKGSFKFPIGTMFWLRAEVLKPLVQLGLDWSDYPEEPLAQDGSILHALERVFGLVAEQMGLSTAVTYVPGISR